jgi:hypothetical protein
MATRSYVGILNPDKSIRYIYVHYDGSPSWRLPILRESYNTPETVNALLDLGDASTLVNTLEDSKFYHRDRGEDFKEVKATKASFYLDLPKDEIFYLFIVDNWYIRDNKKKHLWYGKDDKVIDITEPIFKKLNLSFMIKLKQGDTVIAEVLGENVSGEVIEITNNGCYIEDTDLIHFAHRDNITHVNDKKIN